MIYADHLTREEIEVLLRTVGKLRAGHPEAELSERAGDLLERVTAVYVAEEQAPTFVVVGNDGYWGSGSTLGEAKQVYRSVGGTQRHGYVVLTFEPAAEFKGIDGWGRYTFVGTPPVVTTFAARAA